MTQNINLISLTNSQGTTLYGNYLKQEIQVPIITTDSTIFNSGYTVSMLGDVNKDGNNDFIILAPNTTPKSQAFVIFGKSSSNTIYLPSLSSEQGFSITAASYMLYVDGGVDVNNDGYDDIIIQDSATYIIYGKSIFPKNIDLGNFYTDLGIIISVPGAVAGAKDFNGDKIDDIVISNCNGETGVDTIYVIFGNTTLKNILDVNNLSNNQGIIIYGNKLSVTCPIGYAGDINGDGFGDIIIGMPYDNHAYIVYGSSKIEAPLYLNSLAENGIIITGEETKNEVFGSMFGSAVSDVGDFNNDGYDDVIIGAPSYDQMGRAYIIFGGNNSLMDISVANMNTDQGIKILGFKIGLSQDFASSVGRAGDINNDGYDDVLVSAPSYGVNSDNDFNTACIFSSGQTFVIFGNNNRSNILLSNLTLEQGYYIQGASNDISGSSVSGGFDVNNDGYLDILIGAPSVLVNQKTSGCNFTSPGNSYVIYGQKNNFANMYVSSMSSSQGLKVTGSCDFKTEIIPGGQSGYAVNSAGDVNGDGIDDIIIGSPYANNLAGVTYVLYGSREENLNSIDFADITNKQGFRIYGNTNSYSGWAVSGAGYVNNDGYADIIIGAPYEQNNYGAVYVIFGNKAEYLTDLYLSDLTINRGFYIPSGFGQPTYSGWSVSYGDIDGDRISDIIIGVPHVTSSGSGVVTSVGNGQVVVLIGKFLQDSNFEGLTLNLCKTDDEICIVGITGSYTGSSVNGNCDVNGDRLSDVIVGAPYENNAAGKVYVTYGRSEHNNKINLATISSKEGFSITGAKTGDKFGWSVSCAGDINNDGYDDIILGAPNSFHNGGSSYIIYGQQNRHFNVDLTNHTTYVGFVIQDKITQDQSAWSLSGIGDINKDGYDDLMIGSPGANNNAGKAFVIYGKKELFSDSTFEDLVATNGFEISGARNDDKAGFSVSSAGDFNGDGIPDILVGSPQAYNYAGIVNIIYGSSEPINEHNNAGFWEKNQNQMIIGATMFVLTGTLAILSRTTCFKVLKKWENQGWDTKSYLYRVCYFVYGHAYAAKKLTKESEEKDNTDDIETTSLIASNEHESNLNNFETNYNLITEDPSVSLMDEVHVDKSSNKKSEISEASEHRSFKIDCVVNYVPTIIYDNPELQRVYDNRLGLGEAMKVLSDSANKNEISTVKANEELPSVKDASLTIADFSKVSMLLNARNFIEAMPMVKYASQNIIYPLIESYLPETLKNISYPNILDSKPALFTAHLATGITAAMLLPEEVTKAGVVASSASSAAFGVRLAASHYLAEYRQEKPVDVTEILKQCAVTVFAYTVPSLATCALAQTVMPGYQCQELDLWSKLSFAGSDCYAMYKSTQEPTLPTTANTAVPYIVDTATAVAAYTNGYGLMGIVSSVVTADWMSRIVIDDLHVNTFE